MPLRDLIADEATGRLSTHKLWSHAGYLAMTAGFCKVVWQAQATEGLAWLFFVYGGIVAGSPLASKAINAKFNIGQPATPNKTEAER